MIMEAQCTDCYERWKKYLSRYFAAVQPHVRLASLLGGSLVYRTTGHSSFPRVALYLAFPKDKLVVKSFEIDWCRVHLFSINVYELDESESYVQP